MQGSMATTTKLVRSIFDLMFKGQIDEADTKEGGGRRRRCGNCDVSETFDLNVNLFSYSEENCFISTFYRVLY